MSSNHTPIDHLIEEHKRKTSMSSVTSSKEGEPSKITTESKSEQPLQAVEAEPPSAIS